MDLEAEPQETASLKELAQACAKQFRQLSQDEETRDPGVNARDGFWASRRTADFNIWCTIIGVNSEGLRSVDVRLKDVPEICKLLLHLLRSLRRDLDDLIQQHGRVSPPEGKAEAGYTYADSESDASSLSFEPLSSSEGSQLSSLTDNPLSPGQSRQIELRQHIGDTVDRLQGQTRRIERAGAQHRRKRIEVFREKERSQQMYEGFEKLGLWKANEEFKLASKIMKERIAESFARRRIRFEYLKEHQKKRAVDMISSPDNNSVPPPQGCSRDNVETTVEQKKEGPKKPIVSGATLPQDQRTLFSATVNTKYDLSTEGKKKARAESVRSIALRHPGFPPPPRTQNGRFQCPYCLLEFRDREAEKGRWSQHVMQDFEPYFCTFEDCTAPYDIPNSFDELLDHLQSHLPVRHHVDEPDGQHRAYLEVEFEHHIISHGKVSEETMAAMKEASRRKAPFLFDSCPFCGGYPDVIEKRFPDPDTLDAQRELRKHIKQHMQEIALFLPPYRSDIYDEDENLKGSDVTHRMSNHGEISGSPTDFEEFCDREDCDCKDAGAYAAEDVVSSAPLKSQHMTESRWACCHCGTHHDDFGNGSCMHCDHWNCHLCQTYTLDCPYISDWSQLLGDLSIYDRSVVTDEELFADKRLHPFIMRFAFGEMISFNENDTWATANERVAITRHLVNKVVDFESQNVKSKVSLPLTAADGVNIIKHLLANYAKSQDQMAVWEAAKNGQLYTVRQLLANEGISKSQSRSESLSHMTNVDIDLDGISEEMKTRELNKIELDIEELRPRIGEFFPVNTVDGDRMEAFYKDASVWVEWKLNGYSSTLAPPLDFRTQECVKDLVIMLKRMKEMDQAESLYILHCLGYLKDEKEGRLGLVFEKPSSVDPMEQHVSLRDLLTNEKVNSPNLANRTQLIRLLHGAFERFHAAGYLHRGVRSHNIVFFKLPSTEEVSFADPYITGFEYFHFRGVDDISLPPLNNWNVIYHHPTIQEIYWGSNGVHRPRYSISHDLYSLGIVLLEIALWKPINELMNIDLHRATFSELSNVKERLLSTDDSHVLEWPAYTLGQSAGSVIRACIEGIPKSWVDERNSDIAEWAETSSEAEEQGQGVYDPTTTLLSGSDAQPSDPRGILKRPIGKLPEDPQRIHEDAARHNISIEDPDIPTGDQGTKIGRRLVSPKVLEEVKGRLEGHLDESRSMEALPPSYDEHDGHQSLPPAFSSVLNTSAIDVSLVSNEESSEDDDENPFEKAKKIHEARKVAFERATEVHEARKRKIKANRRRSSQEEHKRANSADDSTNEIPLKAGEYTTSQLRDSHNDNECTTGGLDEINHHARISTPDIRSPSPTNSGTNRPIAITHDHIDTPSGLLNTDQRRKSDIILDIQQTTDAHPDPSNVTFLRSPVEPTALPPTISRPSRPRAASTSVSFRPDDHVMFKDFRSASRQLCVANVRSNPYTGKAEYQLRDFGSEDSTFHSNGNWFPESEIRGAG